MSAMPLPTGAASPCAPCVAGSQRRAVSASAAALAERRKPSQESCHNMRPISAASLRAGPPTLPPPAARAAMSSRRSPHRSGDLPTGVCQALAMGQDGEGRKRGLEYWLDKGVLGLLFAGWYATNIAFNIYNKQALVACPYPTSMTLVQFGIGSLLSCALWATGVAKLPKLTPGLLKSVFLLGGVHTLGNLLTNMSLGAVAVSFTHTIKAMEPFFSVVLSALFLGDVPSLAVLATLLPIVGGVALASMAEVSFNWLGFLTAMGSNLTFQSRNVLSKKLMLKKEGESVDNLSMFGLITAASFLLLAPFSLALEGWPLAPAALQAAGVADPWAVIRQAGVAGLCFHSYQQLSYMILSRVSPVTHSIGNCVKRVIVILAAVVFFSTPINAQSASGTAIALGGVFAYSQVKRLQRVKAEEECQVKWDKDEVCVVPDMTIEDDATAAAGNKYEEMRATS